jgi:adenylate cyclase
MDYFGPMVNRSARVMQKAEGGQILVSGSVWKEIQVTWSTIPFFFTFPYNYPKDKLESFDSPHYSTLGEFELKGLDTPEQLVNLASILFSLNISLLPFLVFSESLFL